MPSRLLRGLGHPVTPGAAMALAHSKLALLRIRSLRQAMLDALLNCPVPLVVKRLNIIERYERAALAKQKRALRAL
ncbi:hypothetical protein [Bradyrhizobium sp. CB1015]|uniref:hypothetical protein n=1 Tax=Bradyrhizobium sp. CB1015 TaxID=2976822 RepID=UPI0021AA6C84|nr:hypothetical protein [Bradyrhizobium sp. CB1015]UWU89962.1 hypothetical protein N2604_26170 [Bradyrhizobium sp. CB1015]